MNKHILQIVAPASLLVFLDQITKYLAVKSLETPIQIIKNFIELEYSENMGIAFGIPIPPFAIIILNIILIIVLINFAKKELKLQHKITKTALSLLFAGALGNLIDRFTRGYVVDFIAIGPWPNFNLADSYICVAILLIILFYGRISRSRSV